MLPWRDTITPTTNGKDSTDIPRKVTHCKAVMKELCPVLWNDKTS